MGGREEFLRAAVPRMPEGFCLEVPHPTQQVFLLLDGLEAFYGGAAGGGKSSALLMSALQYVDVPGYSALLLRRSYTDLSQPGALMDRAWSWFGGSAARPVQGGRKWVFPSGARIVFGYVRHHDEVRQYQSAEYQFIGIDELTEWEERTYDFLFSRLRRRSGDLGGVPLRMRSASNPGGPGHEWVRRKLVDGSTRREGAVFVPAKMSDNLSLDQEAYSRSLERLGSVDRRRLESGDWSAVEEGAVFETARLWLADVLPAPELRRFRVRYWDLAGTGAQEGRDADWTVGVLLSVDERSGAVVVEDVRRFREDPGGVEERVRATAVSDGFETPVRMEQEPGQSGKAQVSYYRRSVLAGWDFDGVPSQRDKVTRAGPVASFVRGGKVSVVKASWLNSFLDELSAFPNGKHDDQVDALSGAFNWMVRRGWLDESSGGSPVAVEGGSPVVGLVAGDSGSPFLGFYDF